jgi:hypothetical protein
LREPSVLVRLRDGTVSDRPLRQVTAGQIVSAAPWRMTRSARGQAHYPGWYWSATTGGHVIYECRLELARLLLADFDPEVVAIAAQPFLLRARAGSRVRRHVPDFLLLHADQTVRVVNVKPAGGWPILRWRRRWPGRVSCSRAEGGAMRSEPAPARCSWQTCGSWPATAGREFRRMPRWTRCGRRSDPPGRVRERAA